MVPDVHEYNDLDHELDGINPWSAMTLLDEHSQHNASPIPLPDDILSSSDACAYGLMHEDLTGSAPRWDDPADLAAIVQHHPRPRRVCHGCICVKQPTSSWLRTIFPQIAYARCGGPTDTLNPKQQVSNETCADITRVATLKLSGQQ